MADEDTDEDNMVMTSGRTAGRRGRPPWAATVGRWPLMTVVLAVAWSRLLLLTVSDANEAVLSNNTYKGEQKSDLSVPIGQSALLPCELDERSILECGIVHSVKWYRGSSRIFLWSAAVPVAQPRKGYHERTSWSYMPNDTIAYLVLDNITAIDEATYKCEITYTAVNEFCNIVQFINLTTYIDPDYISVGVLPADENDDVTVKDEDSDYEDDVQIRKKFTKVTSGNVVGPIDEDNTVRFYCESGRGRPLPQVTWWWNGSPMSAGTDYQYKRFSDGLMMARNVLSLKPVKRGMGGRYECRVRTATVGSPILNSYMDLTINVRPLSVQIISDSGGSESHTVTSVAGGATSDLSDPNSAAYVVEGEGLVVKCIARGARPQANVTWYYYQKDYYDDDDELQDPWRTMYYKGERKIDQHKKPVALFSGQSVSSDDSMTTPPAPVMGTVQIAQHTEYQIDGTRDTHSQLEMAALHRRQDGSILRCDAYNSIGEEKPGTAQQPLTVNMTIRVKYLPTVWLTRPSKIVVNETQTVFMRCEYTANPMNPVTIKWFRDGEEVNVEDRDRAGGRRVLSNAMKYIRINDTVLLIEHAHRSASGEYRCSVRNSVGPANSTNTIRLTVNYAPRVKLDVSIDDQEDSDPDGDDDNAKTNDKSKKHKTDDEKKKALHPYRPAILETDHVNITMRCIVDPDDGGVVVDGEGVKADGTYDSSLNLTTVHWYWNGKQLKLPNCSQLVGHDSETEDENNGGGGISKFYYDPNNVAPGDYDEEMMMVMRSSQDDDTGDGSKRQSRMMCNDRELVLIDVSKNMHGNYSCRARNSAGLLTRMSEQRLLDVYFAPGPVTLEFSPRRVIKGRNVTLKCNTQYLGRPDFPTNYSWYRDGHQIMMNNHNSYNVNTNGSPATAEWFVDHVSLETRANFTCAAYNLGGLTMSEPVYIEVYAPPNYILGPPQYKGVAFNDTHVNASCTVECYPLCTVEWLRQGVPIDPINNVADRLKYMIITEYMQAERLKNDFEAVRSTLVWRLENWTNGQTGRTGLDPATDSAMYSCRSSGNSVGEGVPESIMHFSVEYPPANMSVSKSVVHVNEGNIPEKVFCNADAHPGPSFEWYFQKQESSNNLANVSSQQQSAPQQSGSSQMVRLNTVNSNNWLVLNSAVTRQQAGNYMCVAHNAHGAATITTYLDVMYKPSCQMRLLKVSDPEAEPIINTVLKNNPRNEDEEPVVETDDPDRRILVCTVTSNPGQVQFTWSTLRRDNQSDTDSPSTFPVTEETIVTWGEPVAGQTEADGLSSAATNVSVVILDDNSDGPRTYVCNVVNNVGSDMCSMIVQAYRKSDVPWWKQLLVMIGLGGVGIIQSGWIVVVALAILILIVLAVLILLFYLLCRRCRRRDDVKQKYTPSFSSSRISSWRSRSLLFLSDRRVSLGPKKQQRRQNPEGSATATNNSPLASGGPQDGPADHRQFSAERPLAGAASSPGAAGDPPGSAVGKWPLKPGVLVHVKQRRQCDGSFATGSPSSTKAQQEDAAVPAADSNNTMIALRNEPAANETQSARADRIRRMNITAGRGRPGVATNGRTAAVGGLSKKPTPGQPPPPPPPRQMSRPSNSDDPKPPRVHPKALQKTDWPGNHQHDEEPGTGASSQNGSNGPKNFYENLPFHGMRPALNQFSNTTVTPLTTTTTADAHQKSKPPLPVVSPLLIHRPKGNGYVSLLRQAVASLDDKGDGGAKRFSSLQRPVRNKTGSQQFRSLRVKSNNVAGPAGEALATDPNNNDGDRDQNKQATGGSIFGPVPAPRGRKRLGQETYENLLQINDQKLCCRSLETISYHLERLKFRGNSHGVWFKQQQQPQEPITEQPKLQQQEQLYYDPYDSPIITHHRPLAPAAYQSIEMTRVSVRREQPELQMYSQRRLQPEDGVSTLNSKYYHPGSIQPPQNDDSDGPIAVHSSSSSSSKRRRQSHSTGGYGRSNTIGGRAMAAAEDDEPHQYNNTRRRRGVRMVVDGGGGGGGDGYKTGYDRRRASATAAANNNGNNYVTLGHRGQNSYAGPSTTGTAGARHKRQPPKRSLSSSYYHPGGSATWRRTRGYADDDDDSDSDDCGGRFNRFTTPVEVSVIGHGPGGATYQTPAAADPMSSVKFNRDVGREIDV
ncbi:uncharacterized protein LOC126841559 isoform X3 [Adelges cooleyi]|uniref:uncharacterized protein LOC126841559 isoform X3 n=1 Tax=Adelges cooleyi TaxID=133065 RepID=UPI00218080EF|nr:uncharacterized protein LOC126841559 isoform X3 [Adelges cooleyi]